MAGEGGARHLGVRPPSASPAPNSLPSPPPPSPLGHTHPPLPPTHLSIPSSLFPPFLYLRLCCSFLPVFCPPTRRDSSTPHHHHTTTNKNTTNNPDARGLISPGADARHAMAPVLRHDGPDGQGQVKLTALLGVGVGVRVGAALLTHRYSSLGCAGVAATRAQRTCWRAGAILPTASSSIVADRSGSLATSRVLRRRRRRRRSLLAGAIARTVRTSGHVSN